MAQVFEPPIIGDSKEDDSQEPVVPGHGPRIKAVVLLVGLVALVALLRYAAAVFVPIVLAVLVGYALDPSVALLTRWGAPRPFSALLVLASVLAALAFAGYALRHPFVSVVESLPDTARKLRLAFEKTFDTPDSASPLVSIKEAATEISKTGDSAGVSSDQDGVTKVEINRPKPRVSDYIVPGSLGAASLLSEAGVVLFLVYFLLASGDLYKRKLVRVVGTTFSEKRITVEALHEIDRQIERFLAVQIWISVFVGIATGVALALMGVAQPVIWGLFAGVLNFVPYVGSVIAAVGIGIVAFAQFGTVGAGAEAAGITLLIRTLEGGILSPMLMGKAAGINGAALFVSLLFWGWLWGIIGTLVAVPIMMMVKTTCEHVEGLQVVSELLNEK